MPEKNDDLSSINNENDYTNDWIKFGMRICVTTAFHPIEHAKVLIQLGYEPIAPRAGHTFLGKPALILPNVFKYAKYIKKTDGLAGCYRGLTPKLVGIMLAAVGSEKIASKLGLEPLPENDELNELSDEESLALFIKQLKRDVCLSASCIIITQPFTVISYRMMAQFIGNETTYRSIWSSIKEILRDEGIFGFFSGITPRLLFDLLCLTLASSTTYYVSRHYIGDKTNLSYFSGFIHFLYTSLFYPLQVVSTCMTVSGSRLKAATPPHMPNYTSWLHCYNELSASGEHKRGSSLFWRYYRPTPSYHSKLNVPFPTLPKLAM